uniref:8 kDa glycoprotein n=1 Tax=Taenia hydatigena TaxID=85431 RepID=B6E4C7_TAEHY|nr:8 kDa glycoprotein [Taenia hydatigena]
MRAYIVLPALTVFVVTVSAEKNKPKDVANSTKKGIEYVHEFFHEDPISKQIAQPAKEWKEAMLEDKGKIRTSLVEHCKGPKKKTA